MHDQSVSRLLALPAELRNKIYHFSLVDEDEIFITSELKPPSLLSTCRQVRNEALQIYYFANSFAHEIKNCDARLYGKFVKHVLRPIGVYSDSRWGYMCYLDGADWEESHALVSVYLGRRTGLVEV